MGVTSPYLQGAHHELWHRQMFSFIPDRDLPAPEATVRASEGPAVAFAGFPSDYSLAFLLALLDMDVRVSAIITSPGAHPAILGNNALSRIADHLGVPLIRAWRINDEHARMQLAALHLEAVFMASFDQIVGRRALEIPRNGWLNVHPSLLPTYRGPEPVYWAIADGATETGITLHRAAPRFDAGPILAQAPVAIAPDDTAGTLTRRLVERGLQLLPDAVHAQLRGDPGTPPDMAKASYRGGIAHRSLHTAESAAQALRLVRAGVPNMLAWAELGGRNRYVLEARVTHGAPSDDPWALHFPDGCLVVTATADQCGCHHDLSDCPHRADDVAAS